MAKINIQNGIISSSADYSLYRGLSKIATIQDGEFRVLGDLIAENYIVSSSVTNIEYQSLSGSTIFGDSADDTHTFLGNTISGSATSTGSFGAGYIDNKLGIGTTSPEADLTIQTTQMGAAPITTAATGTLHFGSVSSTSTPSIVGRQTANTIGLYLLASTANTNTSGDMEFNVRENNNSTFATTTNSAFKFSHYTTDLVDILRNGNVGIGVTDPDAPLEIKADGSHILLDTPGAGDNNWITWADNGTAKWELNKGTTHTFNIYSYESEANIVTFPAAGTSVEFNVPIEVTSGNISGSSTSTGSFGALRIDTRAGIGLNPNLYATSGRNLVVGGVGHEGITIVAGTSHQASLQFGDGTGAASYRGYVMYDHNGDYMSFATSASEKMRILSGGNVGIGTVEPGQELEVIGVISASSHVYAGDRVYVNGDITLSHDGSSQLSVGFDATYDKIRYGKSDNVVHEFLGQSTVISGSSTSTGSFGKLLATAPANHPIVRLSRHGNDQALEITMDSSNDLSAFRFDYIDGSTAYTSFYATLAGIHIGADFDGNDLGNNALDLGKGESATIGFADDVTLQNSSLAVSASIGIGTTSVPASGLYVAVGNISGSSTSTGSFGAGYIDNKLGIGTSSPAVQLHLSSSTANNFRIERSGATNAAVHFKNASDDWYAGITSAQDFSISQNADIASGVEFVIEDSTGNVGIGTRSPDGTLHVHAASAGSVTAHGDADDLVVEAQNSGISLLALDAGDSSIIWGSPSDNVGVQAKWNHDANAFRFRTSKSGAKMVLGGGDSANTLEITDKEISGSSTSTGSFGAGYIDNKLGIGTTSPNHTLSVGTFTGTVTSDTSVLIGGSGDTHFIMGEDTSNYGRLSWDASENSWEFSLTDGGSARANALVIDQTGYVGIGTSSPDGTLHVHTATAGSVAAPSTADQLIVENSGDGGISILGPDAGWNKINFGAPSDNDFAFIRARENYLSNPIIQIKTNQANGYIEFATGADNTMLQLVGNKISGSSTSTGSFGSLAIGTGGISLKDGQSIFADSDATNNETAITFVDDATLALNSKGSISVNIDDNNNETTHAFRVFHGAKNASGTKIFEVTETNKISGSSTSTGSFGILELDKYNIGIGHQNNTNFGIGAGATGAGEGNLAIGYNAGKYTTGASNTYVGSSAGLGAAGAEANNVGVGFQSLLKITSGTENVAIGKDSMKDNTTGAGNTAVGVEALSNNTTAAENVAIGKLALYTATTATLNVAIGNESLRRTNTGGSNVGVGRESGYSGTTHSGSVYLGEQAGYSVTTGNQNIAIGHNAINGGTVTGDNNIAIGAYAGDSLTSGYNNVFMGNNAGGSLTTSHSNIAIGFKSLLGTVSSIGMVAIGHNAGLTSSTGAEMVAVGFEALKLATATGNTAIGYKAGTAMTSADDNAIIGNFAGVALTTGGNNTMVGPFVGSTATTSSGSVFLGINAGGTVTTGNDNIAIGNDAMNGAATTGDNNIAIGVSAGDVITTGAQNTIIGADSDPSANSGANQTVIGYATTGVADDTVTLGNASVTDVYMAQDSGATVHAASMITSGNISGSSTSTGSFGQVDVAGTLNVHKATTGRVLDLHGQNLDLTMRLGHSVGSSGYSEYGFYWTYFGTGTGNDNDISFFAENQTGTDVEVWECKQDGAWTFKKDVTFDGHVALPDSKYIKLGADADFIIYHDGATNYVQAAKQDSDIILRGNDGGSGINALTLDMSAGGNATFLGDIISTKANGVISGSSTSTGSFGSIHTAGNVGIGTSSPSTALHIDGTSGGLIKLTKTTGATSGELGAVQFGNVNVDNYLAAIRSFQDGATDSARIAFYTEATSANLTEKMRITSTGLVGIGTTSPAAELDVRGTISGSLIRSAGDVVAYYTSDERLKDNIKLIEKPIEKIQQLRGVEYQWNGLQNTYASGSLDSGIIAQDVQKILPQLVKETNKGYLGVRHDRLVGLLVESIKDQQEQIDDLRKQIKEMKNGST